MKHAQYQHPTTQKFALIRLPRQFAEGAPVSTSPSDYWFCTREQTIAALPELFNGFPIKFRECFGALGWQDSESLVTSSASRRAPMRPSRERAVDAV